MFVPILTAIHITVSVVLIMVVLLQSGKSADLAGAFGGGGSQTAFGPRGAATLLSKITTISAIIFMLTSITLSVLASRRTSSSVLSGGASVPTSQQTVPLTTPGTPQSQPVAPATSGQSGGAPTATVETGTPSKSGGSEPAKTPASKPNQGTATPKKK
jgi:preprotein translocase subunit SecG